MFHKNTNAKVGRVIGGLDDTLRAFANGRKDDWDVWPPYAVFAINNSASTLGGDILLRFSSTAEPTLAWPCRSPTFTTAVNPHLLTPPI